MIDVLIPENIVKHLQKYDSNFNSLFKKALTQKSELLTKRVMVKKQRTIDISVQNNTLNAKEYKNIFDEFCSIVRSLNNEFIEIEILNAGVSVKYNFGLFKRNLFSLRHPRIIKGVLKVNFSLNSVNSQIDLDNLNLDCFDFHRIENYFGTNAIDIKIVQSIINNDFVIYLIAILTKSNNWKYKVANKKRNDNNLN